MTAVADGDGYVLDGEKTWISNGGIADIYCVFARTGEAPGARGLSAFLVPADTPGLTIAERLETIAPHPLATLGFDGCRVPATAMLGQPGQGFRIAMSVLDVFRSTVAAAALGFARRALDEAVARVQARRVQGAPLADLQLVQGHIADMALEVDAAALLVYRAAWTKDMGARAGDARGGDGQAVRDRGGAGGDRHGGAAAWRRRRAVGRGGRAALPRDPGAPDLRRAPATCRRW